jgi:hypothetical protein
VSEEDFDLGKELDEIKARVEEELPHQPVAMGFVKSNTGAYPKSYKVESGSEPGKFYEVTLFSTDVGQCQCKGFSYRRRCSHLSVARARDEAGLTE